MTRIAATVVRDNLSDTLNRVAYQHERIVLRRHGKDVAAIVPIEDLATLEKLEDEIDVREARKALAEMKRTRAKAIPLDRVRKRLGLK